jgi:ABC-type Fe3+-siderophore transport system permease subunit
MAMATNQRAKNIGFLQLCHESSITNWYASYMLKFALLSFFAVLIALFVLFSRSTRPQWQWEVLIISGVAVALALISLFYYRKAKWQHFVHTTLYPEKKKASGDNI